MSTNIQTRTSGFIPTRVMNGLGSGDDSFLIDRGQILWPEDAEEMHRRTELSISIALGFRPEAPLKRLCTLFKRLVSDRQNLLVLPQRYRGDRFSQVEDFFQRIGDYLRERVYA